MPGNLLSGLVISLLFIVITFGAIAGLIVVYHRSKARQAASLEPGDRGYEREAKIFTLYQNLEDMLDGFDAYIEETRASFEMEKIDLLRQREEVARMHANILALSDKMDKHVSSIAADRKALEALKADVLDETRRLTALREEAEAAKIITEDSRPSVPEPVVNTPADEPIARPETAFVPTLPPVVDMTGAMIPPTDALHIHKPAASGMPAPAGRMVSLTQDPASRQIFFTRPLSAEPAATSTSGRALTIRHLFEDGLTVDDIARELGIARNEVTLTLRLMREDSI